MKVWVIWVLEANDYIHSVYDSNEKAEKVKAELIADKNNWSNRYTIRVYDVQ